MIIKLHPGRSRKNFNHLYEAGQRTCSNFLRYVSCSIRERNVFTLIELEKKRVFCCYAARCWRGGDGWAGRFTIYRTKFSLLIAIKLRVIPSNAPHSTKAISLNSPYTKLFKLSRMIIKRKLLRAIDDECVFSRFHINELILYLSSAHSLHSLPLFPHSSAPLRTRPQGEKRLAKKKLKN